MQFWCSIETMTTTPQVFIIGSGAIGKALAAALQLSGRPAFLVPYRTNGHPPASITVTINLHDGTEHQVQVPCISLDEFRATEGILVVCTKSTVNAQLATALHQQAAGLPVIVLQNGLDIERPFLDLTTSNIYRCVLFATSQPAADDKIIFRPVTASVIGTIRGEITELNTIVATLHTSFFNFTSTDTIATITWKKAIINCAYNSICPLLETDNGIFYRNEKIQAIARQVVQECIQVATQRGVVLQENEVMDTLLQISRTADGLFISTLQDIRNKRETEIASLNFAVLRLAREAGMTVSLSYTSLLGEMTLQKSLLTQADMPAKKEMHDYQ